MRSNCARSYYELEIYAYRKYVLHKEAGHHIRAWYYKKKAAYYEKKGDKRLILK